MFLVVLVFVFSAFEFGNRTLTSISVSGEITSNKKMLIEIIFFLSWFALDLFFQTNFFSAAGLSILWHGFFLILPRTLKIQQNRRFRGETEAFLDRVILNLVGGNSFRTACLQASQSSDVFSQHILQSSMTKIFYGSALPYTLDSFKQQLLNEISSIDSQPHAALSRVRGLRRNLSLESEFRQKSDQIRGRTLIQAVFMLGLYLATIIFLLKQGGQLDFSTSAISVTFFATGFTWTLLDGRKIKWKT